MSLNECVLGMKKNHLPRRAATWCFFLNSAPQKKDRARPGSARPRSSCGPASASSAAEAVLELSGRLQNEAGNCSSPHGCGAASQVMRKEITAADLRFRNHLLRRELQRTKERIGQLRTESCAAMLGQELVGAAPGQLPAQRSWWTVGQEASERQPRRPRTAAPKLGQSVARESARDSTDLDGLLHHNAQNLQELTGRLRATELAMGLQRPIPVPKPG